MSKVWKRVDERKAEGVSDGDTSCTEAGAETEGGEKGIRGGGVGGGAEDEEADVGDVHEDVDEHRVALVPRSCF